MRLCALPIPAYFVDPCINQTLVFLLYSANLNKTLRRPLAWVEGKEAM